jgi:Circadian oscillating protein COP23
MINLKSSIILTSFLCLIAAALPPTTLAQPTKKIEFYCGRAQDEYGVYYPATRLAVAGKGDRTVVIWKHNFGNVSPQKRCETISKRFEVAREKKQFDRLITGHDKTSGQGIICATKYSTNKCDSEHMLFALNNKQDGQEIVGGLYNSLRQNGKPLPQSSSSVSIDIQELIDSIGR